MSDYLRSLDPVAQRRYTDRLKMLGLNEDDDPYSLDNQKTRFVDNMARWPPVEYGHIFCYFIQRPGVYTLKRIAPVEESEGVQLFPKWICAYCESLELQAVYLYPSCYGQS